MQVNDSYGDCTHVLRFSLEENTCAIINRISSLSHGLFVRQLRAKTRQRHTITSPREAKLDVFWRNQSSPDPLTDHHGQFEIDDPKQFITCFLSNAVILEARKVVNKVDAITDRKFLHDVLN